MRRRAKKLVGCDQPKELYNVLLAGDRLWLPTATQSLVDRDDAAIQIDFGLGLSVFRRQTFALGIEQDLSLIHI